MTFTIPVYNSFLFMMIIFRVSNWKEEKTVLVRSKCFELA
jgi:hypothetical protein